MKYRKLFIAILAVVVAIILFYSFVHKDGTGYSVEIEHERQAKNDFMRSGDESPFGEAKNTFHTLSYFAIDPHYRISAKLVAIPHKQVVVLSASDGLEKKFLQYGFAEFELNNTPCRLLILEIMEEGPYRGTLFLPFADATSAVDTYGAGRYLDVKKVAGASSITLDFNQAYNPYCAYSDNYSCPFPPKENVLVVAVNAGEKKYHD